jgi:hypothetical protein
MVGLKVVLLGLLMPAILTWLGQKYIADNGSLALWLAIVTTVSSVATLRTKNRPGVPWQDEFRLGTLAVTLLAVMAVIVVMLVLGPLLFFYILGTLSLIAAVAVGLPMLMAKAEEKNGLHRRS